MGGAQIANPALNFKALLADLQNMILLRDKHWQADGGGGGLHPVSLNNSYSAHCQFPPFPKEQELRSFLISTTLSHEGTFR